MNQKEIIDFVLEKLRENWDVVFNSAGSILSAINQNGFDFDRVNNSANPTITSVITILKEMNEVFGAIETLLPLAKAEPGQLYDFERVLLNSRQTVLHMELIMLAMQNGDEKECLRLQSMLTTQAGI